MYIGIKIKLYGLLHPRICFFLCRLLIIYAHNNRKWHQISVCIPSTLPALLLTWHTRCVCLWEHTTVLRRWSAEVRASPRPYLRCSAGPAPWWSAWGRPDSAAWAPGGWPWAGPGGPPPGWASSPPAASPPCRTSGTPARRAVGRMQGGTYHNHGTDAVVLMIQ